MKKLLISGFICLLAGVAVFITGMSILDWDFKKLNGANYVENNNTFEEKISSLKIRAEKQNIMIKRGGDKLSVKYYQSEYETFELKEEDGVFIINQKSIRNKKWWLNFFNIYSLNCITLTVPNDCDLSVEIVTSDGYVNLEKGNYANVNIATSNGTIGLENFKAQNLNLTTKNGRINLEDGNFESAMLVTSNSPIILENNTASYINATTTNSSVTCEDCKITELTASSTNSSMKVENFVGEILSLQTTNAKVNISEADVDNVRVQTTNGSIWFEIDKAQNLSFKTSNASIKGKIYFVDKNAFEIQSSTTNSRNNLGEQSGDGSGKIIHANTTNGDIKVDFYTGGNH